MLKDISMHRPIWVIFDGAKYIVSCCCATQRRRSNIGTTLTETHSTDRDQRKTDRAIILSSSSTGRLKKGALLPLHWLRPMSHLQFYRATLSREKIESLTWHVAQLLNGRINLFPNRVALYSVQLCRQIAVSYCLCDKVAVRDMHSCTMQLCHAIK